MESKDHTIKDRIEYIKKKKSFKAFLYPLVAKNDQFINLEIRFIYIKSYLLFIYNYYSLFRGLRIKPHLSFILIEIGESRMQNTLLPAIAES